MFPVTTHKKLSPSRLFRVFECPGSFRFAQPYDQDTVQSPAAAEGEYMHTVVEKYISRVQAAAPGHIAPALQVAEIEADFMTPQKLTNEQCQTASAALNALGNILAGTQYGRLVLEAQSELKWYDPALYECGGTCDVHWITGNTLHVLDWKFGRSEPIWAKDNDQLLAYATGIWGDQPDVEHLLDDVVLHVVMPRLDHYDHATYTEQELRNWLDMRAIPGALNAYKEDAPFVPGEKQCRWCPGKNYCRHQAMKQRQTASDVFAAALRLPDDITISEVSDLLKDVPQLKAYIADLEKFAVSTLLLGQEVPGFKLVAGRSNRAWKSEEAAEVFLSNLFDVDEIYVSKLKSPSQIEALDRKMKKDEEFKELYHKAQGNPTMVPEYDKRPALDIRDAATVFSSFVIEDQI